MGNPGERFSGMEAELAGSVLDPAKFGQLSLEKKRELVCKIALHTDDAPKILSCWSRRDLLEVLCAEMGKERKYTGLSKLNMIDHLLKLVSEKYKEAEADNELAASSSKRQKKKDLQVQLPCHPDHVHPMGSDGEQQNVLLCKNVACRATLASQDKFCRRCSCSICYHYDDNRDSSLWLTCGSFPPVEAGACGVSCHLRCAFKDGRVGFVNNGCYAKLDGSFRCVTCGKTSGLMGSWRKQLLVALGAQELDVLCFRLSISFVMLKNTEIYKEQHTLIELAVKKLQREVGPIDQVTPITGHGLLARLPCRSVIQKLCAAAVESFDSMLALRPLSCCIKFEEASSVSVVVLLEYNDNLLQCFAGVKLWHKRATTSGYPEKATHIVLRPEKRFPIVDLDPSTEYLFKVVVFSTARVLGVWEANFVTSAPILSLQANSPRDSTNSNENRLPCDVNHSRHQSLDSTGRYYEGGNSSPRKSDADPNPGSVLPLNSSGSNGTQKLLISSDKKRRSESNYENCVRVITMLDRAGHMENDFRVKFLTWFSLRSSTKERRVVSAFVDALIDDPPSLAAQLVDAFKDLIYNNEPEQRPCKKERGEGSKRKAGKGKAKA